MRRLLLLSALFAALSCTGTTGYQLVSFYAVAQGPPDAKPGYTFENDQQFRISLTKAVMHVGAVYLDQSQPTAGSAEGACTLPGTYVGEVRPVAGLDVDMLSPDQQLFPVTGIGSTIPAAIGQVWLSGPDVNDENDRTVVLSIAGTATSLDNGMSYPFAGDITIDKSRNFAANSSSKPGSNPICEKRIVTPIRADVTLAQSGKLVLVLDPKGLFTNVKFADLHNMALKTDPPSPPLYLFTNDDSTQPSTNLFLNLKAAGAVYGFAWQPATH
jgi:hypothetical protein